MNKEVYANDLKLYNHIVKVGTKLSVLYQKIQNISYKKLENVPRPKERNGNMPRKITLEKMSERLDKVEKKRVKRQTEMEAIDKEYKELSKAVAAEKERVRTDRLVKIGEVVCKHFGESITYSEFEETINTLMLILEVKEFILSEKAKCKDISQNEKSVCG